MINYYLFYNDIYYYVFYYIMIVIYILVIVNMVLWGICMYVEMDIIY